MSEEYTELTLSNGTVVRCAPVIPLAIPEVIAGQPECHMPPAPLETITGVAGVTTVTARPGSEEYTEWENKARKIRAKRQQFERIAHLVLGVISWKLPGKQRFSAKVPQDWELPVVIQRAGITPMEGDVGRLGDFIRYSLIKTNADLEAITRVIHQVQPLSNPEIEEAQDFFRDHEGVAPDTGDATG